MLNFAAVNPFTDSGSPWYYVVGALFLVLIFAALAVYIVVSGKRKKKRDGAEENKTPDESETKAQTEADVEENIDGEHEEMQSPEQSRPIVSEINEEDKETELAESDAQPQEIQNESVSDAEEPEQKADTAEESAPQPEEVVETPPEKTEEKPKPVAEKKPAAKKAAQNKSQTAKKQVDEAAKTTEKQEKPAQKQAKPKAQKPFIDRLIADKTAHGSYNAVKNVILSYPGIKAKITKDDEQFVFGDEKKASIALADGGIELKLAVDPKNVPSQFEVEKTSGELPVTMLVSEGKIDSASKLIMFAMNVSLLTRNDKHRYTDYVQKAIDAKNRAKKK